MTNAMSYREQILPVMRGMRELLLSGWGTAGITQHKGDSPVNIVTEVDTQVEKEVAAKLIELYPEIDFVGEEFGGNRDSKKMWLMDPIDGTGHYIRGMPFCTSMLALIEQGEVVFSVIYDFIKDDMYWAEKGKGAYCNKKPLHVSSRPLREAYIGVETNISRPENSRILNELRDKAIVVQTISSGWEHAMVAAGKMDGRIMFEPYGNDYDFAPGSLLIREAGGVVNNVYSSAYDYRNTSVLAVNPVIYKELTEGPDAIFPLNHIQRT